MTFRPGFSSQPRDWAWFLLLDNETFGPEGLWGSLPPLGSGGSGGRSEQAEAGASCRGRAPQSWVCSARDNFLPCLNSIQNRTALQLGCFLKGRGRREEEADRLPGSSREGLTPGKGAPLPLRRGLTAVGGRVDRWLEHSGWHYLDGVQILVQQTPSCAKPDLVPLTIQWS